MQKALSVHKKHPMPLRTGRDYRSEYRKYYVLGTLKSTSLTPLQRLHRKHKASKRTARQIMLAKTPGKRRLPPGMDVDHINKDPLDNCPINLRLMSVRRNRGKCRLNPC